MKKIVITCGLIAGAIISTFMVCSTAFCYARDNFDGSMLLGYSAMLLAFSLVFVGIKNYRDNYNGGVITFGQSFKIGLYIALIGSTVYVVVWLIDYYLFIPDFMEKYTSSVVRQLQEKGAPASEVESKVAEMGGYKEMYKNPIYVILFTYFEILPVGLIVSLISALILKKNGSVRNA